MHRPAISSGDATQKDWQLLTLQGSTANLEACLGLLTPWVKGAGSVVSNEGTGPSRLEIYIDTRDRTSVEQAWTDWEHGPVRALQEVSREWSPVPPEAWHLEWRGHFPPLKVTENITIVPDWDRTTTAPVLIRLHPGMAFGTGHHATTRMMIRQLERLGCSGKAVLDLGAGSGVLAITAILLGAQHVVAVEQDTICEENFHHNLQLNNLSGRVEFIIGDAATWMDFDCDLVLVNIQRSVIQEILNNFARTDSSATLILSGILLEDEQRLSGYCQQCGLQLKQVEQDEEWLSAVVAR